MDRAYDTDTVRAGVPDPAGSRFPLSSGNALMYGQPLRTRSRNPDNPGMSPVYSHTGRYVLFGQLLPFNRNHYLLYPSINL